MSKLTDTELRELAGQPEFRYLFTNAERADLLGDVIGDLDGVLDVRRAALLLGVAPATIRQYARQKIIPATKLGKSWRFIGRDLLEHVREKCHFTNASPARIRIGGYVSDSASARLDNRLAQLTANSQKNSSTG